MLLRFAPRRAATLAASLVALIALVAACGADEPTLECRQAQDGELVPASCEVEGVPTATPTFTPAPVDTPTERGPGAELFLGSGCAGCHTIEGLSAGQLGPDLTQIGGREDAAYIRESILDPDAVIAEVCPDGDCPAGVMFDTFGESLSDAELDTLVAFLVDQR